MSENTGAQSTSSTGGNDGNTPPETQFAPITSQEELNKLIGERVSREREKYSDYKDLKARAARLDELENANKSEAQKLSDALASAERDRDSARTEALRLRIATKHGVSDEDADLFLTGSDEETLTRQAERLTARESTRKAQGNHVPREGVNPANTGNTELSEFASNLFGRRNP